MLFINNCVFKCYVKNKIMLGITDMILDNLETLCETQHHFFLVTYRNKEGVGVPAAKQTRDQGVI